MPGIPDPLPVSVVESGPPLMGKLQGVTHRRTTFWVVIEVVGLRSKGVDLPPIAGKRMSSAGVTRAP
jgi:hypothetical protein